MIAGQPGRQDLRRALDEMIQWQYVREGGEAGGLGYELTLRHDMFYEILHGEPVAPSVQRDCDTLRANLLPSDLRCQMGKIERETVVPAWLSAVRAAGEDLLFLTAFESYDLGVHRCHIQRWAESVLEHPEHCQGLDLPKLVDFCDVLVREWFMRGRGVPGRTAACWGELAKPYELTARLCDRAGESYRAAYFYDRSGICQQNAGCRAPTVSKTAGKMFAREAAGRWASNAWGGLCCSEMAIHSLCRGGVLSRLSELAHDTASRVIAAESIPDDIAIAILWSCGLTLAREPGHSDDADKLLNRAEQLTGNQATALGEEAGAVYRLWQGVAERHTRVKPGQLDVVWEGKPESCLPSVLLISNDYDAPIAYKVGAAVHRKYGAEVSRTSCVADAGRKSGIALAFGSASAPRLGDEFGTLLREQDAQRIRQVAPLFYTGAGKIPQVCVEVAPPQDWQHICKVFSIAGASQTGTVLAGNDFIEHHLDKVKVH